MDDRFEVTVGAGTMMADSGAAVRFPHRWTPGGVTVEAEFTGGHLLHLAAAGCVLNDLYREAATLGIELAGARVTAAGGFDTATWRSTGIGYLVEVSSDAPADQLAQLLEVVDQVAEIPRAIRAGAAVTWRNRPSALLLTEPVSYSSGMPRRTPPGRLHSVAGAACLVFITKGYRRALLTDVGEALGLSHGILYRYAENKEALFELALVYAIDPAALSALTLPLPAPPAGRALELVQAWAADQARFPVLGAAAGDIAGDPATELAGIIDECYRFVEGNQRVLALIKSSALDIPELRDFFVNEMRAAYLDQLTGYLRRRTAAGLLRPARDAGVAARFIIESIAWFGWHRKGDPGSDVFSDELARLTVRELLLAAFVPAAQSETAMAGELARTTRR